MRVNDMLFDALYLDVSYLDLASLKAIKRVAGEGLPIYLKNNPAQAGKISDGSFGRLLDELLMLSNVHVSL